MYYYRVNNKYFSSDIYIPKECRTSNYILLNDLGKLEIVNNFIDEIPTCPTCRATSPTGACLSTWSSGAQCMTGYTKEKCIKAGMTWCTPPLPPPCSTKVTEETCSPSISYSKSMFSAADSSGGSSSTQNCSWDSHQNRCCNSINYIDNSCTVPFLLGGWTNCITNQTWMPEWGCNTILTGRFANIFGCLGPDDPNWNDRRYPIISNDYKHIIYTLGGAAEPDTIPPGYITDSEVITGNITPSTNNDLIKLAKKYTIDRGFKLTGLCFDVESGGKYSQTDIVTWLKEWGNNTRDILNNLKDKGNLPDITTLILVPDATTTYGFIDCDILKLFTHIAPMAYSNNNNSYPDYDYFAGKSSGGEGNYLDIKKVIDTCNMKPNQFIFTFQSFAASSYSGQTNMFQNMARGLDYVSVTSTQKGGSVTVNGPFGGILGWPAQVNGEACTTGGDKDQSNMKIIHDELSNLHLI